MNTMDNLLNNLWDKVSIAQEPLMEMRLYRFLCLAATLLCIFVVVPVNSFQNISPYVNLAVLIFGMATYFLYRSSRMGRNHIVTLYFLVILVQYAAWFLCGASQGSASYFFFVTFMYSLIFFRGKVRWLMLGLSLANGIALICLERFFPAFVISFSNPLDRLVDLITGLTISALTCALMLWVLLNTYDREHERLKRLNLELEQSMAEIKTLRGLLPVCAWCKNIRNDRGLWTKIEEYVEAHSEVAFTHSICPDCVKLHYPDFIDTIR